MRDCDLTVDCLHESLAFGEAGHEEVNYSADVHVKKSPLRAFSSHQLRGWVLTFWFWFKIITLIFYRRIERL